MLPLADYLPDFDADPSVSLEKAEAPPEPVLDGREAMSHLRVVSSPDDEKAHEPVDLANSPFPDFSGSGEFGTDDAAPFGDEAGDFSGPFDDGGDPLDTGAGEVADPVEEARQAAIEETRAALEADHAQAIEVVREEERQKAAEERETALEEARTAWATGEGEKLATTLNERIDRFEAVVKASLAGILGPLARDARRRQSIEDLANAVECLAMDGKALGLTVRGPADLIEPLLAACGRRADMLTTEIDAEAAEVTLTSDQTRLQTRLTEWQAALNEALS